MSDGNDPRAVEAALQFTAIFAHAIAWSERLKQQLIAAVMADEDRHDLGALVTEVRRIAGDFSSIGDALNSSADVLERAGNPDDAPRAPG